MNASTDRFEFAPPAEPAAVRGFVLAVLAHVLLMIALTWGINWKRESDTAAAEAELWSSVPQQAAPAAVQPPPTPVPPVVQAPPLPPAPPVEKVTPPVAPPPPAAREPEIAVEREKQKRELAKRQQEELERKQAEARKKQEEAKRKEATAQKAAEEKKREEQAKAAKDKDKAKQQQVADAKVNKQREENIRRMMASATGTGAPNAAGTAPRAKGPSASYAGRIAARVKPNITFTDVVGGNPAAVVHLRIAPDGTIVGSNLVKSSGVKSWDDAVLRAIDKTEAIPRDIDGSVVPSFDMEFRLRD